MFHNETRLEQGNSAWDDKQCSKHIENQYDGQQYQPHRDTGPAPQCRMEVSPANPAKLDYFLHVLTATDAGAVPVENAELTENSDSFILSVGSNRCVWYKDGSGGTVKQNGQSEVRLQHNLSLPSK